MSEKTNAFFWLINLLENTKFFRGLELYYAYNPEQLNPEVYFAIEAAVALADD